MKGSRELLRQLPKPAALAAGTKSVPIAESKMTPANTPNIMAEPTPREAFMLAMHERVVELEAFAAGMER